MTSIICDSCKKSVPNAMREENYWTIVNRDLCASCYKELKLNVEDTLVPQRPHYSLELYKRQLMASLTHFCK